MVNRLGILWYEQHHTPGTGHHKITNNAWCNIFLSTCVHIRHHSIRHFWYNIHRRSLLSNIYLWHASQNHLQILEWMQIEAKVPFKPCKKWDSHSISQKLWYENGNLTFRTPYVLVVTIKPQYQKKAMQTSPLNILEPVWSPNAYTIVIAMIYQKKKRVLHAETIVRPQKNGNSELKAGNSKSSLITW